MSRLEKLFQKVINDETISRTFDIDPSKYPSIDYAKRSLNPQVKAIVETLLLLDKKIAEEKSEMRIRNKVGPINLDDSDFQPIYRKILSTLTK